MNLIIKTVFLTLIGLSVCTYDVPLVAWTTNLPEIKLLPAENVSRNLRGRNAILDNFKTMLKSLDRIIVLDFHSLNMLDFNKYIDYMKFLKSQSNLMEFYSITEPLSVENLQNYFKQVELFNYTAGSTESFINKVRESKLKVAHINMVTAHLNNEKSAKQRFSLNDKLVSKLSETLLNEKVLYIITAKNSSTNAQKRTISSASDDERNPLTLSDTDLENAIKDVRKEPQTSGLIVDGKLLQVQDCSQLYLSTVELHTFDTSTNQSGLCLFDIDTASVQGSCDSDIALVFNGQPNCSVSSVSMKLNFDVKETSWKCVNVEGSITSNSQPSVVSNFNVSCSSINAPYRLSYSCYKTRFDLGLFNNILYSVQFNNYQVQPTSVLNSRFNAANDCVGFFTVPIISALLISFFLTLILAWAFILLFSCQSTDRFEKKEHFTIFGDN